MPAVLAVIQDVCLKIGIAKPTAVFGSTEREHEELAALSNEVAERICADHDWARLKRRKTYTGDGTTTSFDLPTDYDRMPDPQNVYSSNWTCGALRHVSNHDQWLFESVQATAGTVPAWTILDGQMQFNPAPASGEVLSWYYMSNLYARTSGTEVGDLFPFDFPFEFPDSATNGSRKGIFDLDSDFFQLDNRLLRLGMIWQWKADKGLPYAEDMQNYDRFVEKRMLKDGGPREIVVGGMLPYDDGITYPRELSAS
jgi:hypothetical protein